MDIDAKKPSLVLGGSTSSGGPTSGCGLANRSAAARPAFSPFSAPIFSARLAPIWNAISPT
jgi:hypothetical protein